MFFWFFDRKACEILAPWPGIKPTALALEGEIPITGLPEKSPDFLKLVLAWRNFLHLFTFF